jgi:hypothetical protein
MRMKKARMDGLYLLLLGSAVFLLLGTALESVSPVALIDFKGLYFSARCLLHQCDPYKEAEVLRIYKAEQGEDPPGEARDREVVTRFVNLPTVLILTVPFAVLPYGPAHLIWMMLILGGLILVAFLMWDLGADYAPTVSGALICFLLANSELQVIDGNAAGVAISLCILAVWCFLKERFVVLSILCFALSLALKPHDTGLVWLYFLLAGGVYRKRALQTLAAFAVLSLPVILWLTFVSPHWMQELFSNISSFSAPGGINNPSPASSGAHGIGMVISLQAVMSFFRDDPRFYNPSTYLVCGVLLLAWSFKTLRSRVTHARGWLALAAIAPLSLLPVYHRQGDAVLLMLTIPACAMLWAEGGRVARLALLVNAASFVLTGDLTWGIILGVINHLSLSTTQLRVQILTAAQIFPAPLILLTMAIFYLWVYLRCAREPAPPEKHKPAEDAPIGTVTA